MRTRKVDIKSLTLDKNNARKHSGENIQAIKRSLEAFGQQKPIVIDRDGEVVAGNGTLVAAKELGWKQIEVVETELDHKEAAAFAIADNRSAELATWDDETLAKTLESFIDDEAIDQLSTGFSDVEIDELIGKTGDDIEEDEVPELPEEAITQVGDLWLLGAYYECDDCGKKYDYDEGKKMKDCPCG